MVEGSKETLSKTLVKTSQGISSFFKELDVFKMKANDHPIDIAIRENKHDTPHLATHHS